jgi:hypothetical protein
MKPLTRTQRIALAVVSCYALSYAFVLALAVVKGSEVFDTYSLLVWLISALAVFVLTGVGAGIVFACFSFRKSSLRVFFVVWASLIAVFGLGLVLNAG